MFPVHAQPKSYAALEAGRAEVLKGTRVTEMARVLQKGHPTPALQVLFISEMMYFYPSS